MKSIQLLSIFCLLILSCRKEPKPEPIFVHDIQNGPTPWTHDVFEETEADFTFALISDLNGGEREGVYSKAVTQLNRLDPTFVLSVGDLIDGGTADTMQLAREWDSFDTRTSKLNMPFFYLGGNHDLTHPAMRDFWKKRYGPRYYHFLYRDVLFLMMDSEDFEETRMMEIFQARDTALRIIRGEIEGKYEDGTYYNMPERTTGAMGSAQLDYFKGILRDNPDVKWTFVLMHKPLWMREDEKGLGPLESLLADRPYTVINGHFHSLSHRKRHERDYIILGTTGGSQHAGDSLSMDHLTLIRMLEEPEITHVKMDGILNKELKK
ncbi:MAG: metallophosphoesterase [Bacteroidia bacterium]|nr:metallophosphoesterase [Bacteroidia bacterium]